jgi:hypothetical protein
LVTVDVDEELFVVPTVDLKELELDGDLVVRLKVEFLDGIDVGSKETVPADQLSLSASRYGEGSWAILKNPVVSAGDGRISEGLVNGFVGI